MIDETRFEAMKNSQFDEKDILDALTRFPEDELRRLHEELGSMLPDHNLNSINLEHELLEQFRKVKKLQTEVLDDNDIPLNQRAQVAGQVVGTLQKLIELQVDLQRGETFKIMESCLIDAIKVLPNDVKETFFKEYELQIEKARSQ